LGRGGQIAPDDSSNLGLTLYIIALAGQLHSRLIKAQPAAMRRNHAQIKPKRPLLQGLSADSGRTAAASWRAMNTPEIRKK